MPRRTPHDGISPMNRRSKGLINEGFMVLHIFVYILGPNLSTISHTFILCASIRCHASISINTVQELYHSNVSSMCIFIIE